MVGETVQKRLVGSRPPQESPPTVPARVTVIVPVFNTPPEYLREALRSVARQSIERDAIEILIVDDGSTEERLRRLLAKLSLRGHFHGVTLRVLRHDENRWLAAARVTGAMAATTEYILFLDGDDLISPGYLKKAVALLDAAPSADWVYPHTRCFGDQHEDRPPPKFKAFGFVLYNSMPYASVFRRNAWCKVSQRERVVSAGVRFFEDWDTTIRLMARGSFGIPLADAEFLYRKRHSSLLDRTTRLYFLSIYLTWRVNLLRLPLVAVSQLRYNRHYRHGHGYPSPANPKRLFDKVQRLLIRRALRTDEIGATLSTAELTAALFTPRRFISRFLDPSATITLAELRCGFERKPKPPVQPRLASKAVSRNTILFAHTWWSIGGTENVLMSWLESARLAGYTKILDVAQFDSEENPSIKDAFSQHADEQFCLARVGSTALDRVEFLWQLILLERPSIVFISGNPSAYSLSSRIKQALPDTLIVDILHNEWRNRYDWFSTAHEYQSFIDRRIVISEHWRQVLIEKYREDPSKIVIQRNFINTDVFAPVFDRKALRGGLGIEDDTRLIVFVGRLHEQKNPQLFCELARRFGTSTRYRFLLVGSGPLETELRERYESVPCLQFHGESLAVQHIFAACDIAVFTSVYEGFPLTSLEAASMNVPIIAPDIVGFREQMSAGNIGILYEPTGDPAVDCDSIESIIRKRHEELISISQSGEARRFVLHRHSRRALIEDQVRALRMMNSDSAAVPRERRPGFSSTRRDTSLFLHIGWHKTGSSTIQHFLHHNRPIFASQGFIYPESLSFDYAHHDLRFYFSGQRLSPTMSAAFADRAEYDRWASGNLQQLLKNPDSTYLLSSEMFRLIDPRRIGDALEAFDTRIVVYLRRQDTLIESTVNQQEKMAMPVWKIRGRDEMIARLRREVCDYAGILARWGEVFQQQNLIVMPFESRNFSQGLERGFAELIGMRWDPNFTLSGVRNRRLSRDCSAFLEAYQEDDRLKNQEFHRILDLLEEYSAEHPDPEQWRHLLSPQERLDILDQCRENNAEVARRYLDWSDGELFKDPEPRSDDPFEPYPGLTEKTRLFILEYLLDNGARVKLDLLPGEEDVSHVGEQRSSRTA